jgi:hypothetical protein
VNQDDVATILVSDEAEVLALIAVEKKGGNVNGIVQKDGEKIKFTQIGGGGKVRFHIKRVDAGFIRSSFLTTLPFIVNQAISKIAETFESPAWSCRFTPDMERRSVLEDGHRDNHEYSHHHHSDQPADHHDFIPSNNDDALAELRHFLRGAELHFTGWMSSLRLTTRCALIALPRLDQIQ